MYFFFKDSSLLILEGLTKVDSLHSYLISLDSFKQSVRTGKTIQVEPVYEETLIRQASQPRRKKGGDAALYSQAIKEATYDNVQMAIPEGYTMPQLVC
jgi:hypothetical protein